jgi:N-acetylglucosamine malate deacetylase 1
MAMKVDVLAFGAHPDDVELGCAGTLALLLSQGKTAAIVDLTEGELGTRGSVAMRYQEAALAAKILGVSHRSNLQIADGFVSNSPENLALVIEKIRHYQPEMVFCNAIKDRHPDHAKASQLVSEACFLSGLPKYHSQYLGQNQAAWRPKHVFHYVQWAPVEPDFVMDIGGFIHIKQEACMAYASQFYDPTSQEPLTPIATQNFTDSIVYRARDLGRLSGCEYAEAFTSERKIAFKSFDQIIW